MEVLRMPLEVYDNIPLRGRDSEKPGLTLDKYFRLYINAAMREKLGIGPDDAFQAYLAFDTDNGNIAIGRVGAVNVREGVRFVTFSPRTYYAYVRGFVKKFNINVSQTHHYVYVEKWNGWYVFRCEDLDGPSGS